VHACKCILLCVCVCVCVCVCTHVRVCVEICVQLALGMGGFRYARIVNSGQSCVPVLLTFLHKTEEQSLVLLIFFSNVESFQCVCGRFFPKEG